MWSEFGVPQVSQWRDKLKGELGKARPGADVAVLEVKAPEGLSYQPLYTQPSEPPPPLPAEGLHDTRPCTVIDPQCSAAPQLVQHALTQDCRDYAVSLEDVDKVQALGQLRRELKETVAWQGNCASLTRAADHLAATLPLQRIEFDLVETLREASWAEVAQAMSRLEGAGFQGQWVFSTVSLRERGATMATELAVGLAGLVEWQRVHPIPAGGLGWSTGISPRLLLESAKCRSMRQLWQKFIAALGISAPLALHGVESRYNTAYLDQATNLLRSASVAWVACLAGCATLRLEPYSDDHQAPHLAINQLHLLRQEGFVQKVTDPLAGTYALETWSDQLARQAWEQMRALEKAGGLSQALASGDLDQQVKGEHERQAKDLDLDRQGMVGVTRYVAAHEGLAERRGSVGRRLAEPYEALHQTVAQRKLEHSVAVLLVGSAQRLAARMDFTRNFLAIAGFEPRVVAAEDGVPDIPEGAVVLCSSDADHAEWVPRCLAALRPGQVLVVAGQPKVEGTFLTLHRASSRLQVLNSLVEAVSR